IRGTYGVRVLTAAADLTDTLSRAGLFERLRGANLRFRGLVNVAGIDYEGPFYEQSARQIQTIIRLNVEGTLDMIRGMLELRDPLETFRILNVASLAAYSPMPVKATYAASKRFLLDFSLALREELRGLGATVTVLCPAGMPTTPENIRAIQAQGFLGQITTLDAGAVANTALDYTLAGRAVCVPGAINRLLQAIGSLAPAPLAAGLIGSRWKAAHRRASQPASA
ncbi:MAG TPA: SDR family NAD(P)-dependent oxidoreductase, partial [Anaerolinea sp.]|nr:SDR family NAD(P)-dependent oxidoreductase [Anaerolinea sp.]